MKKHIFAPYIMENTVNDLRVYDIMWITHLNIAFGLIRDNVVTVDHLQYLDRIAVYKRINPQLKVILSIGGWGADGFSQAAMTKEGRSTFVSSALEIIKKYDFDGADIDWEYPCIDTAEIACDPKDKQNFTYLMQDLRDGLSALQKETGKAYLLTCAAALRIMRATTPTSIRRPAIQTARAGKRPSAFITRQAFPTGKWCSAQHFTAAAGRA